MAINSGFTFKYFRLQLKAAVIYRKNISALIHRQPVRFERCFQMGINDVIQGAN